jgi:putative photosynthetic complex assembly protein
MSTHSHADMLPRGDQRPAGALVVFAFSVTAAMRIAHVPPAASPAAMREANHVEAVASRNLRFIDRADGAVVIEDVRGSTASVIEPGQQTGFIRGVMRGLARERKMRGLGDQPPFKLTLWRDGELSLTDSVTGRSIEMTAFGSSNRASFMALLPKGSAS